MLKFERMTKEEFNEYLNQAIETYAIELEQSRMVSIGKGKEAAKNQFNQILPNGIDTPNYFLYQIINEVNNKVGILLYGPRVEKEAFIIDFLIHEEYQNRGYGKLALLLLEEEVKSKGFDRIGLHVFGNNKVARHIYEKHGFEITSMQMEKKL